MLSGLRSLWAMQLVWRKLRAEVTSRMTRLASLSVNLSRCWMCLRRWPPNIRSNTRLNWWSSSKKSTKFKTFLGIGKQTCAFTNKLVSHQQNIECARTLNFVRCCQGHILLIYNSIILSLLVVSAEVEYLDLPQYLLSHIIPTLGDDLDGKLLARGSVTTAGHSRVHPST